jgi:glutamate-1-semialdehyde 2,1-aminomutase/spore coat polysaccharide biosynthesis protein SpsF
MSLGGRSALEHVLRRCAAIPGVDTVVCATTSASTDDPVAREAERLSVSVFRGSETDVLARYAGAAEAVGAQTVMRVTSDCPLIDPAVCGAVLNLVTSGKAVYATNNMPPSWPHGLDCEAFSTEALLRANREARGADEREHVTPWLRRNPELARVNLKGPGGARAQMRWTLDYPEDFKFLTAVFARLPDKPAITGWEMVADMLERHPEITALNTERFDCNRLPENFQDVAGIFQV